jgi:hypothetical protein
MPDLDTFLVAVYVAADEFYHTHLPAERHRDSWYLRKTLNAGSSVYLAAQLDSVP